MSTLGMIECIVDKSKLVHLVTLRPVVWATKFSTVVCMGSKPVSARKELELGLALKILDEFSGFPR